VSARLAQWLLARSRRERLLDLVLALALLGLAATEGVIGPLAARRAAARAALDEVAALEVWLAARRLDLALLPAPAPAGGPAGSPAPPPAGLGGIEARLLAHGLRDAVGLVAATEGGGVALRFPSVEFGPLMGWLDAVETGEGYRVAGARLRRGAEGGTVEAEIDLAPAGG